VLSYRLGHRAASGFMVSMLSQMGIMIIFALSYNMQMGQTGLLSFGHAVFPGPGRHVTAHTLNAVKAGSLWLPLEHHPARGGSAASSSRFSSATSRPSSAPPPSP